MYRASIYCRRYNKNKIQKQYQAVFLSQNMRVTYVGDQIMWLVDSIIPVFPISKDFFRKTWIRDPGGQFIKVQIMTFFLNFPLVFDIIVRIRNRIPNVTGKVSQEYYLSVSGNPFTCPEVWLVKTVSANMVSLIKLNTLCLEMWLVTPHLGSSLVTRRPETWLGTWYPSVIGHIGTKWCPGM
jgi:hypothetical protein